MLNEIIKCILNLKHTNAFPFILVMKATRRLFLLCGDDVQDKYFSIETVEQI